MRAPRRGCAGMLVLLAAGVTGCTGAMRCEDPERYAGAESIPPLRVPGDIGLPDDEDALRIPPEPASEPEPIERVGPCLEHPPYYSPARAGDGRPGG